MNPLDAARPEDAPAVDAFLAPLSDTSMFLRGNIRAHGVCGGDAASATRVWIDWDQGRIAGVVGLTAEGMVHVQMPVANAGGIARAVWTLDGIEASGITGEAGQVRAFRAAARLEGRGALDQDEPLYVLDLAGLVVPPGPGAVRVGGAADAPMLKAWRTAYLLELLGTSPRAAPEAVDRDVAALIDEGTCRVIEHDGLPVGMTALNAALPDAVQIGGVYTPPEFRGRGFARRAVALHLRELREAGVTRAVLFASGPAACRAYEAIGFRRVGAYALVFFAPPVAIGAGL